MKEVAEYGSFSMTFQWAQTVPLPGAPRESEARGLQTAPATLALWSCSFFGSLVILKVKLKKFHKMAFDQNLTNEEIWENPFPLKMMPNHSILFDIEPKID